MLVLLIILRLFNLAQMHLDVHHHYSKFENGRLFHAISLDVQVTIGVVVFPYLAFQIISFFCDCW